MKRRMVLGLAVLLCGVMVHPQEVDAAHKRSKTFQKSSISQQRSSKIRRSSGVARPLYAALVMDVQTGRLLHNDHAFELRSPASLTKVMTAYVAFQEIKRGRLKLSDRVVFSKFAASREPSKFGLKPGQSLSTKDTLMVTLVRSCNDAAEALGEKIGGSPKAFARLMTLEARRLGLKHSHFYNASGLPHPLHKTTAYDMAVLTRKILNDWPQFISWFGVKKYRCQGRILNNTNRLLGPLPDRPSIMVEGFKTGWTNSSGSNLIATVRSGQKRWIVVVMGEQNTQARDRKVLELIRNVIYPLHHEHDEDHPEVLLHVQHKTKPVLTVPEDAKVPQQSPQTFQAHLAESISAPLRLQVGVFKNAKQASVLSSKVQKWALLQGLTLETQCTAVGKPKKSSFKVVLRGFKDKGEAKKFIRFLRKQGVNPSLVNEKVDAVGRKVRLKTLV